MLWHKMNDRQPDSGDMVLIAFRRPIGSLDGDIEHWIATYGDEEEHVSAKDGFYNFYFGIGDMIQAKHVLGWSRVEWCPFTKGGE